MHKEENYLIVRVYNIYINVFACRKQETKHLRFMSDSKNNIRNSQINYFCHRIGDYYIPNIVLPTYSIFAKSL